MDDFYAQQQCPPNTTRYHIQAGDTLYGLARRYGTTTAAIVAVNPGINPDALEIGQQICIPRQLVYPSCPSGKHHVVRRGDTLYSIAIHYNVSLDDLMAANPSVNPNTLAIGQVLCIPGAAATPAPPATTCPAGYAQYTVVAGDTLYAIAVKHGVSLSALLAANPSVNPNSLMVGQMLCVPASTAPAVCPTGALPYTVMAGDTFYSIAMAHNIAVNVLVAANPTVNPANLMAGQVICIPSAMAQ